ncbi:MAG: hypothetical protein SGI97_06190 [candidate division Zixibacteria bacterium]|nr:hypothetical protein [candidate division Zixibacteria bacterium]
MRKKVLLAEASESTRRVADLVLKQNGFEVIAVATAERAKEVLQFTRPDILVIGSGLTGSDMQPFYEKVQADSKLTSIPMLLIQSPHSSDLPFPPEVIIPQPLEPHDFIARIQTFIGQSTSGGKASEKISFESPHIDDNTLDEALGIGSIEVTDSEVMDRTSTSTPRKPKTSEKMIGYDHIEEHTDQHIDSMSIRDNDLSSIRSTNSSRSADRGTGQIEIVRDQYGLVDAPEPQRASHGPSDYDWFVNSMQQDNTVAPPKPVAPKHARSAPVVDSGKLRIKETSTIINPVTKPITQPVPTSQPPVPQNDSRHTTGVEKFIDEFKKEIELFKSTEPESVVVQETDSLKAPPSGPTWEEKIEITSTDQISVFTRQLSADLAERLAEKIASKIDPDKLIQLIKSELLARHLKP